MKIDIMRDAVLRAAATDWRRTYDFRVEFSAVMGVNIPTPPDIALYVIENSYTPTEVTTEETQIGMHVRTRPTGIVPITYTMTVRDDKHETFGRWFDSIAARVANPDGTRNLPYHPDKGYLVRMKRYRLVNDQNGDLTEELADNSEVMFTQRGEINESYSEHEHLMYPVTIKQFRSK